MKDLTMLREWIKNKIELNRECSYCYNAEEAAMEEGKELAYDSVLDEIDNMLKKEIVADNKSSDFYVIKVHNEPELFNNKNYYFWCILKNNKMNVGHGWRETPEEAFKDAKAYADNFQKKE